MLLRRWMFSSLRAERRRGQVFHVSALKKSPNLNTASGGIKALHLCCRRVQVLSQAVAVGEAERAGGAEGAGFSSGRVTLGRGDQSLCVDGAEQPFSLTARWGDGPCEARLHRKILTRVAQLSGQPSHSWNLHLASLKSSIVPRTQRLDATNIRANQRDFLTKHLSFSIFRFHFCCYTK